MVEIGARITVESERVGTPARCGTIVGLDGPMVRVRWDDGKESSFVPAEGSMRVIAGRERSP